MDKPEPLDAHVRAYGIHLYALVWNGHKPPEGEPVGHVFLKGLLDAEEEQEKWDRYDPRRGG